MGALGAVEESFPRKIGHGDDGDEGINPCALLRQGADVRDGVESGIR